MAVDLAADYSFSAINIFVSIFFMSLFAKEVLLAMYSQVSDCYQSIPFKALLKAPNRKELLEEMKEIRKVQLRDLVDHTNSFLAQQQREAWGGIMLNGEPIKAQKKYSNEDIGALPEPLLEKIVEGMGEFEAT